jgi:hypothetical protein
VAADPPYTRDGPMSSGSASPIGPAPEPRPRCRSLKAAPASPRPVALAVHPVTIHTAGAPPPGALALMRKRTGRTSSRNCQPCNSPVTAKPPGAAFHQPQADDPGPETTQTGGKPGLVIAAMQHYPATREGISTILGNPVMVVFLSSLATLVAVGLATRLAQRNDDYLGDVPSFRAE